MSNQPKHGKVGGAIISLTALLSAFVFLYIGFVLHTWHPTWLIFISIPIVSSIVEIATKRSVKNAIPAIVSIICVVSYLYLGFFLGLWHPGWLIFFAIPVVQIIVGLFAGKSEPQDNCCGNHAQQDSDSEQQ